MKKYLLYGAHLYSLSILRPLQRAIKARGDEVAWFFVDDMAAIQSAYMQPTERVLLSAQEVKAFEPQAVFSAANAVPDFFPGIKVQLFHGFNAQKRNERKGHYRIRGFFDLYCTQGPHTTERFRELASEYGHFEVVETGWPKMDPLFASDGGALEPSSASVDPSVKTDKASTPKTVFFASTFTARLSAAHKIYDEIARLVASGKWRWLCNLHPKMDREVVARYKQLAEDFEHFDLVETDNIIPLLRRSDILLADTSSIISEFLLQYKPVVTFQNQKPAAYMLNVEEPSAIESAIDKAMDYDPALLAEVKRYADHIHPYRDAQSSVRVLAATDALIARGLQHLKRKPLNVYRRLKMRKALAYYRWR